MTLDAGLLAQNEDDLQKVTRQEGICTTDTFNMVISIKKKVNRQITCKMVTRKLEVDDTSIGQVVEMSHLGIIVTVCY